MKRKRWLICVIVGTMLCLNNGCSTTTVQSVSTTQTSEDESILETANNIETSSQMVSSQDTSSMVYNSYLEAKEIDESNIEKSEYKTTYHGISINQDELEWLEDGAVYRSLAKKLEGFYMEFSKSTYNPNGENTIELICGVEAQPTWEEMKPYVDKASLVVTNDNTLDSVMTAIQALSCVEGNFDFENKIFDFQITDLEMASNELGISQQMLGYTLAMLDEYGPNIEFGDNNYKCTWFRK